jgi:hypothetical protein
LVFGFFTTIQYTVCPGLSSQEEKIFLILRKNFRGITFFASTPKHPSQIFFLHFLDFLFFPSQDPAPLINILVLFVMLSNIIILLLKSPLHFLSPILQTFLTISLICALSLALSLDVTQVFELVYLFYFPFFLVTLILFTLPLSLIEQHVLFYFFFQHLALIRSILDPLSGS